MTLTQLTAPYAEPVSLTELRTDACRQDDTIDNTLIANLGRAAREKVENDTRRQIVSATWQLRHDAFPAVDWRQNPLAAIDLRICPVVTLNSVKYVDTAGTLQTLVETTDYTVDLTTEPARIVPAYGKIWPSTRRQPNAVLVEFVAGLATPFTAVAATDVITPSGRTFAAGDKVRLFNLDGALPAGLATLTDYYVIAGPKLSLTSGGAAVDITDAGTGTQYLLTDPRRQFETCRTAIKLLVEAAYDRDPVMMEKLVQAAEALLVPVGWGSYV